LFEPITFAAELVPENERRFLHGRLATLDPSGGYRPADDGVATSLAWLVAGSVIAWTPAERAQNSFFDPSRGAGLNQAGGLGEFGQSVRLLLDGGSLRGWATGTDFNLDGPPSTAWIQSPQNDVGLPSFYDQLELSVAAPQRAARNTALARALMAMGGVLAVLQDAGEPAHVRNDFRGAFLRADAPGAPGPFNRGSVFERFVADRFGAAGVPAAGKPINRPTVLAYFTAPDAQGLADRTQRRFFSDGTLPEDGVVDRDTSAHEVVRAARESLIYGLPGLPRLELREMGRRHYVYAVGDEHPGSGRLVLTSELPPTAAARRAASSRMRRLLAYERVPGHVRFFLDGAVYQDTARALLPEIGAFGAGLIDHLLRGEAVIKLSRKTGETTGETSGETTGAGAEGGGTGSAEAKTVQTSGQMTAQISITGARGAIHDGQLRVFADDQAGIRQPIGSWPASALAGGQSVSVAVPAGTRLVAAVLRAQDDAGVLVAAGEQAATANE
jgi:hypothetical protein